MAVDDSRQEPETRAVVRDRATRIESSSESRDQPALDEHVAAGFEATALVQHGRSAQHERVGNRPHPLDRPLLVMIDPPARDLLTRGDPDVTRLLAVLDHL